MRSYSPEQISRAQKESRPNEYEEMRDKGLTKEDRSAIFYRPYATRHSSFGSLGNPGRRETRNYVESIQRLLPMPPGSTPITKELMDKTFRGKSGRVKQVERAVGAVLVAEKNNVRRSKEHQDYVEDLKDLGLSPGSVSKAEWREIRAKTDAMYRDFGGDHFSED